MFEGVVGLLVVVLLACGEKKFVEGQDYVVLERLRVMDNGGFGEPVAAYSFLVPKGWQSEGGITWRIGETCTSEAIENRVTVRSPDGAYQLDVFPTKQWDWWDDPTMLQAQREQQQNPLFRRCPIAEPMDASAFLRGPMAEMTGARVTNVEPAEQLGQLMRESQQANQTDQQAGVPMESRPSAAVATLAYPDGSVGLALAVVSSLVTRTPNLATGSESVSYQCVAQTQVALKVPADRETEAREILATAMSSLRLNPSWQQGASQILQDVRNMEMAETAKRAAIQKEAQEYSANLQRRTWEGSEASRDRINDAWGQTLRGVETWSDGSGSNVELQAGYGEAWSRLDGTYILSNDPLFDPNVVLQEDWKRLAKAP
jgi:hypothetical protein